MQVEESTRLKAGVEAGTALCHVCLAASKPVEGRQVEGGWMRLRRVAVGVEAGSELQRVCSSVTDVLEKAGEVAAVMKFDSFRAMSE